MTKAKIYKILVTPRSFGGVAKEKLEGYAKEVIYNDSNAILDQDKLIPLVQDVDGIIAGLDYYTEDVLNAAKKLKVISRYGAGTDRVDAETANKRKIVVTNTPGANADAVADLVFGLMLAVSRKICLASQKLKSGQYGKISGTEVYSKNIGVIGTGRIGKKVIDRARGFSMEIMAYDIKPDYHFARKMGFEYVSLERIYRNCDFISLHAPLTEDTRHIINGDSITKMKDGVIIINTARGGLIDEDELYKAVKSGKIGGIGLDVFEKEPPDKSELLKFANVVATPHIAAHTKEAINNMGTMAVTNLIDVLEGRKCKFTVSKL